MTTLVFFLEEESAKLLLQGFLPKLIPNNIEIRYLVFEGKQDLRKQLGKRLRGWIAPDTRFVVIHDQDSADCIKVKNQLKEICNQAGKPDTLVRIACHELESFYLGDLQAVEQALSIPGLSKLQASRKFRSPDTLNNAAEELKKITSNKYQKLNGSRSISIMMRTDGSNRSQSFNHLCSGIMKLLAA